MKGNRYCQLCLTEKMYIARNFCNAQYLNKRSDLALKIRHRAKHRLSAL